MEWSGVEVSVVEWIELVMTEVMGKWSLMTVLDVRYFVVVCEIESSDCHASGRPAVGGSFDWDE